MHNEQKKQTFLKYSLKFHFSIFFSKIMICPNFDCKFLQNTDKCDFLIFLVIL